MIRSPIEPRFHHFLLIFHLRLNKTEGLKIVRGINLILVKQTQDIYKLPKDLIAAIVIKIWLSNPESSVKTQYYVIYFI